MKRSELNKKLQIQEFSTENREYFKMLNYEWLSDVFSIESHDEIVLSNPESEIIDKGGMIYFAEFDSRIVGTVALIKVNEKVFELAKMAVEEGNQCIGIGRKLLDLCIQKAMELRLEKLIQYSNTKLDKALKLYLKNGFKEVPPEAHPIFRDQISKWSFG